MKEKACQVAFPAAFFVVMLTFLSAIFFVYANPSFAAPGKHKSSASARTSAVEHTEARIKQLQGELKITAAQEKLWNNLTQVMRQNAIDMDALTKDRAENTKTMNAVEYMIFQTNTFVAEALYEQARAWVDGLPDVRTAWDLYCGVGGFALHLAAPGRAVLGVEISADAITAASATAAELGLPAEFVAADATAYVLGADGAPDLVVVNPPRRGIGPDLAGWLEQSGVRHVVYSSCNANSLARDLALMPSLRAVEARVLDMFPHTTHYEVLVLLSR